MWYVYWMKWYLLHNYILQVGVVAADDPVPIWRQENCIDHDYKGRLGCLWNLPNLMQYQRSREDELSHNIFVEDTQ